MEILTRQNHRDLLGYLPHIKSTLNEWKLVDIRLTGDSERFFTIGRMAELVHTLFRDKEGKIYMCNEREIFLLIRWGLDADPLLISRRIEERCSAVSYEIVVHEPTSEGLQQLEMLIRYEVTGAMSLADTRGTRRENVVLVAADEKYMQALVRMGIPSGITVHQVTEMVAIMPNYRKYAPDIIFLDVHMQGRSGAHILQEILDIDREAYVIMLTDKADTASQKNLAGARGFLTKPFSPNQLMEYLKKCPTLS